MYKLFRKLQSQYKYLHPLKAQLEYCGYVLFSFKGINKRNDNDKLSSSDI